GERADDAVVIGSAWDCLTCTCADRFFFSSRRRHTRSKRDWSSDVCSSDLLSKVIVSSCRFRIRKTRHFINTFTHFEHIAIYTARSEERRVGKERELRSST